MVPAFSELLREARAAVRVPGAAAGLLRGGTVELAADGVLELGRDDPVRVDTPFLIASVSKAFTAALLVASDALDDAALRLLSHSAGLRIEVPEPLPDAAGGLFSYSNAGYRLAGERIRGDFSAAMRERVLAPLGLGATGYDRPAHAARGHAQEGETGHRPLPADAYPVERRPIGGLWSTVSDLLAFAEAQMAVPGNPAFEPQVEALGARYALGWWVRDGVVDHEGSVAGYQSLLMLLPAERTALAVLTNSWRGSGLVRRLVERLGLLARPPETRPATRLADVSGRYALDGTSAVVEDGRIMESEADPVTGAVRTTTYPVQPIGGGVYGFAGGTLMSHRVDFPRPGVARIGWTVLLR